MLINTAAFVSRCGIQSLDGKKSFLNFLTDTSKTSGQHSFSIWISRIVFGRSLIHLAVTLYRMSALGIPAERVSEIVRRLCRDRLELRRDRPLLPRIWPDPVLRAKPDGGHPELALGADPRKTLYSHA
jgi:hypothetical protein